MKIVLFITIIFTNGVTLQDKIPFNSYDDCYMNAMSIIRKIESQHDNVEKLYAECVEVKE